MPYIKSVFISGRYVDMTEERQAVIDSLVGLGFLPLSMEYFPAGYRNKDDYIAERIQESDYFALIIGNSYGGYKDKRRKISFTEWEYNLARRLGKNIIAFVCSDENQNSSEADLDPEKAERLKKFKKKVMEGPLVGHYAYKDIDKLREEVLKAFDRYGYNNQANSKYIGPWISQINSVEVNGQAYTYKSDEWTFFGKNNHVFGTIKRMKPEGDHRQWEFTGLEFGDQLLVSFADKDPTKISAGIMIVQKVSNRDAELEGFYYEFSKLDSDNRPIPIPIILQRRSERNLNKKTAKGTSK